MDFRKQIEEILRPVDAAERDAYEASLGSRFMEDVARLMPALVAVVRETAAAIPGAEVVFPAADPRDCGHYVVAARIPAAPDAGFVYPVRLYFVVFPPLHVPQGEPPALRVVNLVAIGAPALSASLRSFLRAWNDAGIGGAVVYDGVADPEAVKLAGEQAVLRFLQSRADAMQLYERSRRPDHIILWPIDPSFQPHLCSTCLSPVTALVPCRFCVPRGIWLRRAQEDGKGVGSNEEIERAAHRGSLVRVIIDSDVYRGSLIAKNENVISIRLRSENDPELPRIGETAELILEESNSLRRFAARVHRAERFGDERRVYLTLL